MKPKKKPSGKKIALIVLNAVLSLIFVALLAVTVYVEWILGKFYYDPALDATLSQEQIDAVLQEDQNETKPADATVINPGEVDWGNVETVETADHITNILLVGQDRRPGEIRARSDTMILITVNTQDYSVTMTSFLRDIYVQIPGYAANRLNVPYVFGGYSLLYDTLEQSFGVRPDKFVEVDFDGFKAVIDLVGGVDIQLTAAEAAYMNGREGESVVEGLNHMDGETALKYARNRSVGGSGDFGRTLRQRNVINALFQKVRTLNLTQINELLLALTDVITTDMTSAEIMSYVVQFYPMLDKLADPVSIHIPADDTYYFGWVDGIGSVLITDFDANSAIIAQYQD